MSNTQPAHAPLDTTFTTKNPAAHTHTRTKRLKLEAPWLILIALMLATLAATYQSYQRSKLEAQARFAEKARSAQQNLIAELHNTADLLRSASALVSALPKIEPGPWDIFFDAHRRDDSEFRGLVRITYKSVDPINPILISRRYSDLAASLSMYDKQINLEQNSDFIIALKLADETREMVTTNTLRLTNQPSDANVIVALILPVYAAPSSNNTLTKTTGIKAITPVFSAATTFNPKIAPLLGHLTALIRLDDIVNYISAHSDQRLSLTLLNNNQILYSNIKLAKAGTAEYAQNLNVGADHPQWILQAESTQLLEHELANDTPRAIFLVGLMGTLLLTGLVWLLTRLRNQAETLAARITEKLQDQVKFTEDLIEFNPNPIFRKDADGRFTAVNRAWEQLSGRNRKDVLGKTNHDFQRPEVALQNELADRNLYASEQGYEANEIFISNANGRKFETIISKQVLRRADGTVDGLIGTITDITPKKKLEQDLAQQREQLDLVIRSAQQGIWDIELKPGGHRYFSERFMQMLGYSREQPLNDTTWRDQLHPDNVDHFASELVRHFKRETPYFDTEARVLKQNGEYIWVRVRAVAQHNEDGLAIRFVGSIGDITKSKEAEAAMREANTRVIEAARAKEAFLATMSHEIRTPLNGVLGMAGLLSETSLNGEQRDYIRLIHASGDTLLRLIDDVLDFSKIESGRMTLEAVPVEIITLVEEAFELVAEKAREKQLALIYDIREDVPFYILGDATRLRQILLNMLSNAIKFTERGQIKLTMSCRHTLDGKLELEGRVTDTGIGIPAERLSKLFQPFTQADTSTTRKYGGTGLGLAIIRRLTQLMHGDVRIESTEGEGTTFIFTVATQAARGPLSPYMQRDVLDFVGKRLLLVESCVARHPGMHYFLTCWGFQTTVVFPENAAAALLAEPLTDIIMTDCVLPSEEGDKLQRAMDTIDGMRAANYQLPVPCILLSKFSRQDLLQRGVIPPVRHDIFLLRPCGRPKMFDALMRAVLREFSADSGIRPLMIKAAEQLDPADRIRQRNTLAGEQIANDKYANSSKPVLDILVAEDNEINQRVISGMLRNLNQRVTLVENGLLAVQAATSRRFDVILMDIHMPELDGTAAMHAIRAHFAGHLCPPIVAMTAHAMAGDREQYLDAGMDDYLSKPIRTNDLTSLLARLYKQKNRASRASQDDGTTGNASPSSANPQPLMPFIAIDLKAIKSPTNHDPGLEVGMAATDEVSDVSTAAPVINISPVDTIPVLDKDQLEDLRYLPATPTKSIHQSPADPVTSLLDLFQTKAVERMHIMEDCLVKQDWKRLADTAHSLRGASASVGFPRVAALCRDMETGARRLQDTLTDQPEETNSAASRAALGEVFKLIQHHYREADSALGQWLTGDSNH